MHDFMHSDAARLHFDWQGDCCANANVADTIRKKGHRMAMSIAGVRYLDLP